MKSGFIANSVTLASILFLFTSDRRYTHPVKRVLWRSSESVKFRQHWVLLFTFLPVCLTPINLQRLTLTCSYRRDWAYAILPFERVCECHRQSLALLGTHHTPEFLPSVETLHTL